MPLLEYERTVMQATLNDRRYVFLLVALSAIFTAIYLVLLPSLPNRTINRYKVLQLQELLPLHITA